MGKVSNSIDSIHDPIQSTQTLLCSSPSKQKPLNIINKTFQSPNNSYNLLAPLLPQIITLASESQLVIGQYQPILGRDWSIPVTIVLVLTDSVMRDLNNSELFDQLSPCSPPW